MHLYAESTNLPNIFNSFFKSVTIKWKLHDTIPLETEDIAMIHRGLLRTVPLIEYRFKSNKKYWDYK
jgi:hypothetical protein